MSARSIPLTLAMAAPLAACATAGAEQGTALTEAASGQKAWAAACGDADDWDKPGPPFRVFGQTYYVGTCGITALLVSGPDGLVLIDSGTDAGAEIVLANIRALGFDPRDVKAILMSHEHFDHVGGMARLQAATGAPIVATPDAAKVLRSGQPSPDDPQAMSDHPPFPPVTGPITELTGEQPRTMGGTAFTPIATPGHTLGAMSWSWQACERTVCRTIVYVDSLNPISSDGYRFTDHPALVTGFRAGIARVAAARCDIVLAPHPAAAAMRDRLLGSRPLIDAGGCRTYAATATGRLDKRLASEAAGG
jgi:metallo-beta-lactamase class B